MEPLHSLYYHYLHLLDVAFQPIVDIHSGALIGVEALLRGTDELGFESIFAFFDQLYADNVLYTFDLKLREKVIEKFCTIDNHRQLKLFYNIDNRLLNTTHFAKGNTSKILQRYGLDHKSMVFELSEHNEIANFEHFTKLMDHYAQEGFCIAIDDFGIGQSGYKHLYHSAPNLIKIDRFFLQSIDQDPKKKILVRHMVQLATLMGARVIAEGVETIPELMVCKEVGCHLLQGYLVQRPMLDVAALRSRYEHVSSDTVVNKRDKNDQNVILKRLICQKPVMINDSMETLLEMFKREESLILIPIVDTQMQPMGIIHEHRLKSVIYSPYGSALIRNRSSVLSELETYIEPIPVVDLTMSLETMIELFSLSENAPGVLVVDSSRYIGYLSARVMIELIHERNLIRARDENPLTRLPGNYMINEYIAQVFSSRKESVMCYFDFDHFKPYNDYYGFRNGDRVILLFADLMRKILSGDSFIGHIGGDDFFAGSAVQDSLDLFSIKIERLVQKFNDDVREFYDVKDRERGFIAAEDRFGELREFKLLNVSAVVVRIGETTAIRSAEQLHELFALEKKRAKKSEDHIIMIDM